MSDDDLVNRSFDSVALGRELSLFHGSLDEQVVALVVYDSDRR
jgi:hypothetical protein